MRRPLLICLAAFLAATLAAIAFFFVPETSRAAPPPSEGGIAGYLYPGGYRWPQRAFARGRHQTKRLSARRCSGDGRRPPLAQGCDEGGAVAHRHPLPTLAAGALQEVS